MATPNINSNNRASLLAGLRTGGVRSTSLTVPHTAAPAASFNISHFLSQTHPTNIFPEDDESDQVADIPQRPIYVNRNAPITAAVDGPNNRFSAQQAAPRGMNPLSTPFNPPQMMSATQMQVQMMQLEMLRLQTVQAQQIQAEMIAQAQLQQAAQIRERRVSLGFNQSAATPPIANGFSAAHGPVRRPSQAELLRAQLGLGKPSGDQGPATPANGGRFATRSTSLNVSPNQADLPATPSVSTTVISGGTSLGSLSSNNAHAGTPSKSDAASSWRRAGNNSVLTPHRVVSTPGSRISPQFGQRASPPPAAAAENGFNSPNTHLGIKFRPQPLRFSPAVSQPLPTVAIDLTDDDTDGSSDSSVKSMASKSSPTTPRSTSSHEMPLSPREEASRKLFEGLGISRPISATPSDPGQQYQAPIIPRISTSPHAPGHRMVSHPTRQPRGPPSGADELGPKNFATRIKPKVIQGLGLLRGVREYREVVEAY